jgi:hypothetical protein
MNQRKKTNRKILAPKSEETQYSRWLRKVMVGYYNSTTPLINAALILPKNVNIDNVLTNDYVDIFLSKIGFKEMNKVVNDSLERSVKYFQEPESRIAPEVLQRANTFETQETDRIVDTLANIFEKRKKQLQEFRASVLFDTPEKVEKFSEKYERPKFKFSDTWSRTSINGLNRDLALMQASSLGYTKCRWDTSGDERVRSSHAKLNGKVFDIRNLPKEYNDYNCRCVLTPIFD